MTSLEKVNEMLEKDPELLEKLQSETGRLTDSGEKDIRKISAEAVKATFGVDLTGEELDQVADTAAKASTKLDLDELDNVAGGASSTLAGNVAAVAQVGFLGGATVGCAVGNAVPLVGTAIGTIAGAAIGAVVGAATGAVTYIASND